MYPNHQQLDSKYTLLIDSSALPGRVCALLLFFQPTPLPAAEMMPPPVSMSCRFYTLIPGKQKHFSKEFFLAWQENRNCFLSKWKRFSSWETAKAVWKRGQYFHPRYGVFSRADRKTCFPSFHDINQIHKASYLYSQNRWSGNGPRGHSSWSGDLAIPAWKFSNPSSGNLGCFFSASPTLQEEHIHYYACFHSLSWVELLGVGEWVIKGEVGFTLWTPTRSQARYILCIISYKPYHKTLSGIIMSIWQMPKK